MNQKLKCAKIYTIIHSYYPEYTVEVFTLNLREIAQALNVSPSSVSIVRKGLPGVSAKVRRQIQQLLIQNGYTYREYAALPPPSLSSASAPSFIRLIKYRKSALLVDQNEGFVEAIIDSVDAHARQNGYTLIFSAVTADEYDDFLHALSPSSCAGLLVVATEMDRPEIMALSRISLPLVVLDCDHPALPFSTVTMNNRDIAYHAVSHFLSQGHKQIGYLRSSIPTGNFLSRAAGYREALYANALVWDDALCFSLHPSADGAYRDMLAHLAADRAVPSALFADNDILAIGAMRALQERGFSVPGNVSIIGVDNTPLSQICTPALSTMQISRFTLGKYALNTLLEQINHPSADPIHIRIDSYLVNRQSVAQYDHCAPLHT